MRTIRRFAAPIALLLLAACRDASGPDGLQGKWLYRKEEVTQGHWSQRDIRLNLRGDGSFIWSMVMHADWGRPSDKLLGYTQAHGRYELVGDSLFLSGEREEGWDYLTGSHQTDSPYLFAARSRVRVTSNRLVLDYAGYPPEGEMQLVFDRD